MCHGPVYMIFWKSVWWQFWFFSLLWSSLQWRSTASPEIIHQCQRTFEIAMNKKKKKKKRKPTKREMLIDGQQSAYLPWISSWFLTDIHRAMGIFGLVFYVLRKITAQAPFCKNKKKKVKKKSIQVLGILPKKHSVSSSVHAAHCALKEQLYECLCDAALQHPLHRAWSQPAVPPWVRSSPRSLRSGARRPPAANIWEAEGGKTPPWGPSVGCICIPHPASCIPPGGGAGRVGKDFVDPY